MSFYFYLFFFFVGGEAKLEECTGTEQTRGKGRGRTRQRGTSPCEGGRSRRGVSRRSQHSWTSYGGTGPGYVVGKIIYVAREGGLGGREKTVLLCGEAPPEGLVPAVVSTSASLQDRLLPPGHAGNSSHSRPVCLRNSMRNCYK